MKTMDVPEKARLIADRVSGNASSAEIVRNYLAQRQAMMYEPQEEVVPDTPVPLKYSPQPDYGDYEYPVSAGMMSGYPIPLTYQAPVQGYGVEASVPVSTLDPVKDAARRIMAVENSKDYPEGGWDAKTGRWYPHKSVEGGCRYDSVRNQAVQRYSGG